MEQGSVKVSSLRSKAPKWFSCFPNSTPRRGIMRKILAVFVLAFFAWPGLVLAGERQVFVPKPSANVPRILVILDHHLAVGRKTKSPAARRLVMEVSGRLEHAFRRVREMRPAEFQSFCEIILRDWDEGDPNFKITCIDRDDTLPYERLPETVDELMKELNGWVQQRGKGSYQNVPFPLHSPPAQSRPSMG